MQPIKRHSLLPRNRDEWLALRKQDVTSTEVSALFNESKYMTAYELACLKAGDIEDQFQPNERSEWGQDLEASIAKAVARKYGVRVRKKNEYMRLPDVRAGASFDFEIFGKTRIKNGEIIDDYRLRTAQIMGGRGLLEIKNVDSLIFKNEWEVGTEPQAPPHIEIQLQHQLMVSGYTWGVIAALVGGNKLHLITRYADEAVHLKMQKRITNFWADLTNGVYPPITMPDDAWVIKKIYSHAEPGKLLDARGDKVPNGMLDLIARYEQCARIEKKIKDRKSTAQAELLRMIGDHERVLTDVATISCNMVAGGEVTYFREPYRYWKVTPKKLSPKPQKEDRK